MNQVNPEDVKSFVLDYISRKNAQAGPGANPAVEVSGDDAFDFLKAGAIDSTGIIEMLSAMEEHFGIAVDFEQMDPAEFTLLGAFSRYVAASAVPDAGGGYDQALIKRLEELS